MTKEFTHAGSWECDAMLATVIEADQTLLQVADEHDGQFLVFTVKEAQSFRDWLNRVLPAHEPCEQRCGCGEFCNKSMGQVYVGWCRRLADGLPVAEQHE